MKKFFKSLSILFISLTLLLSTAFAGHTLGGAPCDICNGPCNFIGGLVHKERNKLPKPLSRLELLRFNVISFDVGLSIVR